MDELIKMEHKSMIEKSNRRKKEIEECKTLEQEESMKLCWTIEDAADKISRSINSASRINMMRTRGLFGLF